MEGPNVHAGVNVEKPILKIGIVLNYKNAEKKKDELLSVDSKDKPWLQLGNQSRYKPYCVMKGKKKFVPADVAITPTGIAMLT